MTDIDRNKFREYTTEELRMHVRDGKNVIEDLKKIRGVADILSIGAVNMLTRVQGYTESSQSWLERELERREKEGV